MKIQDDRQLYYRTDVTFRDLEIGDVFSFEEFIHIKVNDDCNGPNCIEWMLAANKWESRFVQGWTEVILLKSKLIISERSEL